MKFTSSLALFAAFALSALASSPVLARPFDACKQGYVWREAFPGDHVCVTPGTRAGAARDNRMAKSRIKRGGGAYGPDTCIKGFVWREANRADHVCVRPEIRRQTAEDNRFAKARIARHDARVSMRPGAARVAVASPPPPRRADRARLIACPVKSVRAEITTRLPDPWWQTPQMGGVVDTKVMNVGGTQTLTCFYQAYGNSVAVMRKMPRNTRHCEPVRGGFRCR